MFLLSLSVGVNTFYASKVVSTNRKLPLIFSKLFSLFSFAKVSSSCLINVCTSFRDIISFMDEEFNPKSAQYFFNVSSSGLITATI